MPTPRRPVVPQLLVTALSALAVVALYLYLTRPKHAVVVVSDIAQKMRRPMTLRLANSTLDQALNTIAEQAGVTIEPDWKILESFGVLSDDPVSLTLHDVSAGVALQQLLGQFDNSYIVWGEQNGLITVSDATPIVLRAYDLRDLIEEYLAFEATRPPNPAPPPSRGIFAQPIGALPPPTAEEAASEIMTLIAESVDRDSWINNGGVRGRMEYKMNRLLIAQTLENHEKIQRILLALRLRDTTEIDAPDRSDP